MCAIECRTLHKRSTFEIQIGQTNRQNTHTLKSHITNEKFVDFDLQNVFNETQIIINNKLSLFFFCLVKLCIMFLVTGSVVVNNNVDDSHHNE